MGEQILIAFIPQKRVVNNQQKIRKLAGIKVAKKSGLNTPHITIIDNSYSDIKEIKQELQNIIKETKPFTAKIKGLETFKVKKSLKIEKYQGNNSLIYLIKNNPKMYKFRREALKALRPLRTEEKLKQWKKDNPNASKRSIKNMGEFGSAFGGKEWVFHSTVGLIPKTKEREILTKIKKLHLSKEWTIKEIGLFRRKNGWKLVKKYSLR